MSKFRSKQVFLNPPSRTQVLSWPHPKTCSLWRNAREEGERKITGWLSVEAGERVKLLKISKTPLRKLLHLHDQNWVT
jgi:hypothetical protein